MRVFRLQCLLFIAVAGLLACGGADAQPQIVPAPPVIPAQAQIAQPRSWCLRWTDTCTSCQRRRDSSEIKCTVSWRGQRAGCIAGATRCVMADNAALKDACEQARTILEECNTCVDRNGAKLCTNKGCPVQEIVCVKPKT